MSPEPRDWWKGHGAGSRAYYDVSVLPSIIDPVTEILGGDVILWGASIQSRGPGQVHPWHSDIESATPGNRTVAVWIGLENTTIDSSLGFVARSHRFDVSIQEARHQAGRPRDELTPDDLLALARERDAETDLVRMDMSNGDAVFFDGKLWHGSHNLLNNTRRALLLQYATPDSEIRIPDPDWVEWPFRLFEQPRPPCVVVRGKANGVNRIVDPPAHTRTWSRPTMPSRIARMRLPLEPDDTGWKPYPNFQGATASLPNFSSHASGLAKGHTPHPPEGHIEEELLLLLSGEVRLQLPELEPSQGVPVRPLTAGEIVYYPAFFPHTLTTVSEEPANYLMFKWNRRSVDRSGEVGFGQFRAFDKTTEIPEGFHHRVVLEGTTAHLRRLQCHESTLSPGAGYDPHVDPYDVVLVVIEGEIETLGERMGPGTIVYCPSGESHGMLNPSSNPARYLVFEFEGGRPEPAAVVKARSLAKKVSDPDVWRDKLKYEWRRLKRSS
jgi:quercetin dioxygenase-like cupin family protein